MRGLKREGRVDLYISCFKKGILITVGGGGGGVLFERVCVGLKEDLQYFVMLLFIILYKFVLTCESLDEILQCDHSNESY